ncbi:hypothetical protein P4O66_000279 [Electrophorus voltai]|uniref:Uncharacterized protein n=1 Tax=Electrophorus voltai TaxID=2609070 RepID=A0AAD8ZIS5_9TELE|nr:hypothetical protein P4O66_000279 [Electrophorus voltai]
MEVEEALQEDSASVMDMSSADSKSEQPPAPQAPHKAHRARVSKLSRVTRKEVVSSSSEDTPSLTAHSPRARVPTCKPQGGKKEVSPVPTPEADRMAGVHPEASAQSQKSRCYPNRRMAVPNRKDFSYIPVILLRTL